MHADRGRVHVRLSDFLGTGRIGPIGVGSTRAEVVRAFGVAKGEDAPRGANSELVWSYGRHQSIEFGFSKAGSPYDPVYYLQVQCADARGGFSSSERLAFFDEGFRKRAARKEGIERFCISHGVRFIQIRSRVKDYGLLMEGGVCVWCGDDDNYPDLNFQTFITDGPYWAKARHMPVGFDRLAWQFEQLKWDLGSSTRRRRTI